MDSRDRKIDNSREKRRGFGWFFIANENEAKASVSRAILGWGVNK